MDNVIKDAQTQFFLCSMFFNIIACLIKPHRKKTIYLFKHIYFSYMRRLKDSQRTQNKIHIN